VGWGGRGWVFGRALVCRLECDRTIRLLSLVRERMKEKRSWQQRIISILICLGACWLFYAGVMNWMAWHYAREVSRSHQNLGIVPTPLRETTTEELKGPRIGKFGFSFQVPWEEIDHDRTTETVALMSFKEGVGLAIFNPDTVPDGAKTMRGSTARQFATMTSVFGAQALSSNYELMVAEVRATPADVKWWAGRSRNVRSIILLTDKSLDLRDATAIHEIRSGTMRGFQFGDPGVLPCWVNLDLFDAADRHYRIWITGKDKSAPCVTQAQINGLVASIRPLPSGPVSMAPSNGD
jgi:hypothetical protein